ncbi:hypothetical protein [Aquiflexum lacus]|uniref:hypothetical protein n=1 Tax=Aquiflexum lacus TaxID=2483805 RepID=UPI0018940451|nr:hypothetical protein [Aquiflexum lacus]
MNCQVEIEIEKIPLIAKLISQKLNQIGYLGNMANLLAIKKSSEVIIIDRISQENETLIELLKLVEKNFSYTIKTTFSVDLNVTEIEEGLTHTRSYENLSDLIARYTPSVKKDMSLSDFYLAYIFYWQSFGNIHALKLISTKNSSYQGLLNLAIFKLYNKYCKSNTINVFLNELFDQYYYGYILGDDVLKNLFLGRIRLFIFLSENRNIESVSINKFLESIFNVDTLFKKKNEKIVIQSYQALINFCYAKLNECLASNDETEIILSHAKLIGLVGLIRKIASEYGLMQNWQLSISKDFFEEIHCDCMALKMSEFSYFKCPSYIHWIIFSATFDSRSEKMNMEKLLLLSKERIFLSKRVLTFIYSQDLNLATTDQILEEINLKYSDLDERIIMPLYLIKNIKPQFLRNDFFDANEFETIYNNYGTYSEDIYYKYIKLSPSAIDNLEKDIKHAIISTHNELCQRKLLKLLKSNSQEIIAIQEKIELSRQFELLYPYSSIVKQQVAYLWDINLNHSKALDAILKGILLDFNNLLLWESLRVIVRNLKLFKSWEVVNSICNILNEKQK